MASQPPAPHLWQRSELALGLAFWAVAGVSAALTGALGAYLPFAAPVVLLVIIWPFVRGWRHADRVLDWLPLPLVGLTYEMLHGVVPTCWPATIDETLRGADRALFGGDVAVMLEPYVSAPLTVLLAAAYSSYYVLAASVCAWWYRDVRYRRAFREMVIGQAGLLFVGYLGYLFLPAIGPHAYIDPATFGVPIEGDFIGDAIRSRNEMYGGQFPRDAFPSLHTANAVTLVLMLWRHERRLLWLYGGLAAGIVAATIYLRFHYVVDVAAGAALAVAWQWAVPRLLESDAGPPPA